MASIDKADLAKISLAYIDEYRTISFAWLTTMQTCLNFGREYIVQRGSYAGQKRRQLDFLAFRIIQPWTRPLATTHRGLGINTDASIQDYFENYLINPSRAENEQYTYGERIFPQLEPIAQILRETPKTNQASISIARPEDIELDDPPCLREITWTAIGRMGRMLQMAIYFRSWDLHTGMPTNLGGLQLLNELMAEWAGLKPGQLVCFAVNAHLYEHSWGMLE